MLTFSDDRFKTNSFLIFFYGVGLCRPFQVQQEAVERVP